MQVIGWFLALVIALLCKCNLAQWQFTLTLTSDFKSNGNTSRYAHTADTAPYQLLENSTAPTHIANVFCSAQAPPAVFTNSGFSLTYNRSLWSLNGVPITNGSHGFAVTTDTVDGGSVLNGDWRVSSRLFWPSIITPDLSGIYRCTLFTQTDMFRLHVQVRARIVAATPSINITLGNVTTLQCDSVGDNPVVKIWMKNGHEVDRGNTSQFPLNLQAVSTDSGAYICSVSNSFGADSRTLTVNVQVPARIIAATPSINITLATLTSLQCDSVGDGIVTKIWRKNGQVVLQGNTAKFPIILQAVPNDSANYTCSANNTIGFDSRTLTVTVQVPARIISATPAISIVFGNVTTLRCNSQGESPVTTSWLKNGQLVARGNTANYPLTIQAVRNDSAKYTCTVNNTLGADSRTLVVTVQAVPIFVHHESFPVFVATKANSSNFTLPMNTLNDGNSALIGFTLTCTPAMEFGFASQKRVTLSEPQGVIDGLQPGVTYTCTFIATNSIGNSSRSAAVDLTTLDSISAPPSLSVTAGDSESLKVNYTAPALDRRNGAIVRYLLTYNRTNCYTPDGACPCSGYSCSLEGSVNLDLSGMYVLNGLRRFTGYALWLQAENGAGPGVPVSVAHRTAEYRIPSDGSSSVESIGIPIGSFALGFITAAIIINVYHRVMSRPNKGKNEPHMGPDPILLTARSTPAVMIESELYGIEAPPEAATVDVPVYASITQ
eukprot:scpid51131/ scgid18486/ Down syndrome cell adhesion molecule-like protein 1; Down syndrome cell adhesion molecule 2